MKEEEILKKARKEKKKLCLVCGKEVSGVYIREGRSKYKVYHKVCFQLINR